MSEHTQQKAYQATPPPTIPLPPEAFLPSDHTTVYWLGASGVLVNCRGTTIMMDPVLSTLPGDETRSEVGGMELLAPPPIRPEEIKKLDAIFYTHADADHMGALTAVALLPTGAMYHTTPTAAGRLRKIGVPDERIVEHPHHSEFSVNSIPVRMTGAFHPHQTGLPANTTFFYGVKDCTGFRLETQDGIFWNPGDTMLMEEHLHYQDVDFLMIDFSDNEHHWGREISIHLANWLRKADMLMFHWGTFYAPDQGCYCADPKDVVGRIVQPERLHVCAPGQGLRLRKK